MTQKDGWYKDTRVKVNCLKNFKDHKYINVDKEQKSLSTEYQPTGFFLYFVIMCF